MLINLFNTVRAYGIPASVREFLDLLNALEKKIVFADWNEFYYLSRSVLVKDEKYFDKFFELISSKLLLFDNNGL